MNTLCLVTDQSHLKDRSLLDVIQAAIRGGVNMIQLREKTLCTRDFIALAMQVKRVAFENDIPFIINDRVDIALAVDADGVHIGQSDMPYDMARAMLGRDKIIGLSAENLRQIIEANDIGVDYVAVSPLFSTPTKTDTAEPFGMDGLRTAVSMSLHPVLSIGGINIDNIASIMDVYRQNTAPKVLKTHSKVGPGIAVVSSIMYAPDPERAARTFAENINKQ